MVELFQSNDSDIIDLLMRSFHKDYTLHFNVHTFCFPHIETEERVFLCVMRRCDVTLYDYIGLQSNSADYVDVFCCCCCVVHCDTASSYYYLQ